MMEKSKCFRELVVWQKAHQFVLDIYKLSNVFPKAEIFGLTSQLRRAAISIPANIAEGFARTGKNDKLRFYTISLGSLNEVSYYLLLCQDLNYSQTEELQIKADEIGKMLKSYSNSIQNSSS
jgi:four helix bundle protein